MALGAQTSPATAGAVTETTAGRYPASSSAAAPGAASITRPWTLPPAASASVRASVATSADSRVS